MKSYPFEAPPPLRPEVGMTIKSNFGRTVRRIVGKGEGGTIVTDLEGEKTYTIPVPALKECWHEVVR